VHRRPRLSRAAGPLALAAALAGCAGTELEAAPHAADPACAGVLDRLPPRLLDAGRGSTDVAGAAVWGDPRITLRCGVPVPGPSTDRCLTVDGVDWVLTEPDGAVRFTSYGRSPALELTVPERYGRENAPGALTDLVAAVSPLPQSRHCE
jgi:hypothetical protein